MSKKQNKSLGAIGENLAQNLLKSKGYQILGNNLRTICGEIDILALDGSIVVICEVKTKSSPEYGIASEMITAQKQQKLRMIGKEVEKQYPNAQIRFDVIAVDYEGSHAKIEHIVGAFH